MNAVFSSGQALAAMQEVAAATLPRGFGVAWTGAAYQELAGGNAAALALGFGIVMVFLILAAQYGSWTLPISVLLAVPFGLFGALLAVWMRGLNNDIYFQVGLITLVPEAASNKVRPRWSSVPMPDEPTLMVPGRRFAAPTRSFSVRYGESRCTTKALGSSTSRAISRICARS